MVRNLREFPLSDDEVLGFLKEVRDDYEKSGLIYGTQLAIINYLEQLVKEKKDKPDSISSFMQGLAGK